MTIVVRVGCYLRVSVKIDGFKQVCNYETHEGK